MVRAFKLPERTLSADVLCCALEHNMCISTRAECRHRSYSAAVLFVATGNTQKTLLGAHDKTTTRIHTSTYICLHKANLNKYFYTNPAVNEMLRACKYSLKNFCFGITRFSRHVQIAYARLVTSVRETRARRFSAWIFTDACV